MSRRAVLALWLLAALLAVMTLAASGVGALRLPVSLLWTGSDDALRQIWLTIRLPRVLLALAIGGSLALAGCVMQGLFRNPLADPGLLGISSGAALAVALWVVLPLSLPALWVVLPLSLPALVMLYAPMLAAFLGALAATFVIFLLSRQRDSSLSRLLLVGIAINALCGAAVGVLSWLSNDAQLRQLSLWGMGSLGQAQWSTLLAVCSLMVPTVLVIWRLAGALNLLQLGEEEAHYLGVEVAVVQRLLLLCSALLVAAAVAVSGVIGFVGLVVPHLVRMWLGADHRAVIPGSVLAGALLLLAADTLARTLVAPAEMPVGLLTSLLGAPWFLWLIFRRGGAHG
ncbi:FecCD family ABC transporter permease [Enterobacter cloacae]|uniref:FecCD family ABC transporter permease n=2 Tax=Enterobacter cloacae TaxID=550 RepID=UPI001A333AF0|nr:iron ABC transporter permease [Enterobacter cloacae]